MHPDGWFPKFGHNSSSPVMFGKHLTSKESLNSIHITIPEVYEALTSLDIEKSCDIDRIAPQSIKQLCRTPVWATTPLVFYVIASCYFTLTVYIGNSIK